MSFKLRLLSQNWIDDDPHHIDLCSHGSIYLKIGDNVVADEEDGEWTVSTSALIMLRSAITDYITDETAPMIHHCGQLMMVGCPISVCWTVQHNGSAVLLSGIRKQPTTDTKDLVCYLKDKEQVTVSKATYVRDILRFADAVAQFLENSPERVFVENEYDRNEYSAFLDEFNSLRDKARDALKQNA